MTTLLVAGRGRCTSACWDATTPECSCACAGAFHGGGRERAMARALLELPGEDVVVLPELPLLIEGGKRLRCVSCWRSDQPGLRRYGSGLYCRSCREAALVLVEA